MANNTGPAVRTWNGTDIDRLAIHYLIDGRALCSAKLLAMFVDTGADVTCKRCIAKAAR